MAIPGVPGSQLPRGEDHIPREVADIKRSQREGFAAVAQSFGPVVVRLEAQDVIIGEQVAELEAAQVVLAAQGVTLVAQTAALAAQDVVIAGQVSALAAANATLAAQQASLAAAVANIATLVGQQTTGSAGNNFTPSSASLGTSFGSYAIVTFNVPAGYTVAAVTANTAAAIGATQPVQIATRIAGADGPVMNLYPGSGFANGASNYARVLTVASGGTFTVETRALVSAGSASAMLTTAASVTFYR